ncbi:uncharacterized protein LOC116914084 [Rattus rattus]|uniref:uncharacterized protein LOC116914084 n=1 Tax=Rattus rattus TaxID=10117 RepID=UPI0013F324BC|nr:uncharacterized protein LOC116914084 [Rattus rattus]
MRRKRPRALGSLRNPVPQQGSTLYTLPVSVPLIPSQPANLHLPVPVNPLSVFYPTTFPSLRNTSNFPTLMMAMPSSSSLAKTPSNYPVLSASPSYLSTLMTTSPERVPRDSGLLLVSYPKGRGLQPVRVPGKSEPETKTGSHKVKGSQDLFKLCAFIQGT